MEFSLGLLVRCMYVCVRGRLVLSGGRSAGPLERRRAFACLLYSFILFFLVSGLTLSIFARLLCYMRNFDENGLT